MPISTSEFILLGCLLALRCASIFNAAAPAETHPDHPAPECIVLPTPAPTSSSPSSPALPGSCYTTRNNTDNGSATVLAPSCFTQTSTIAPSTCPTPSCPPPPTDQVCPLYIKVSSVTVPCATDCCPTTSTAYVEARSSACPTCDPCRIPTEWITYVTGCAGTPTITQTTVVTPTF